MSDSLFSNDLLSALLGFTAEGFAIPRKARSWLEEGYDSPYVEYDKSGVYGEPSGMKFTEDALAELLKMKNTREQMWRSLPFDVMGMKKKDFL